MDVFLFNMHLLFFCTIIKLNICINQLCKSVCLIIFCLFITISNNVLNTGCKCCIFRANKSRLLWELSLFGFLLSAEVKKIKIKMAVCCTCWHWSHIPLTWRYAKPCFFFFFRELIHVVAGLISTAWAP